MVDCEDTTTSCDLATDMTTESHTSVRFDNAPVVESILGIQFPPLAFTSGHLGWFWKSKLADWPKASDAPPLQEQFERFGEDIWGAPAVQFLRPGLARLQLINADDDRVVQLQNTRFMYNWRKRWSAYPSYQRTREEFFALYKKFAEFVLEAGLGAVSPNQWEIAYIDHVPKGQLWQTAADWHAILPGLFPGRRIPGLQFEGGGEWQYVIEPQLGRVHIAVQHGRIDAKSPEVLVIQWTARGAAPAKPDGLGAMFDLGHEMILRAFLEITSPEAQKAWGRKG